MFALTNFFDVLFEVIYGKCDFINKVSNSKCLYRVTSSVSVITSFRKKANAITQLGRALSHKDTNLRWCLHRAPRDFSFWSSWAVIKPQSGLLDTQHHITTFIMKPILTYWKNWELFFRRSFKDLYRKSKFHVPLELQQFWPCLGDHF